MIGYILTCKEKHLYSLTCRTFALSLPYKSVSRHLNIFQSDPDFITSLVGWSVIIDYQLVISLFQQLMVTQLRIMECYSSLTARQTVNVFVLSHIALPPPDDTKKENHVQAYAPWGALSLNQRDSLTSKLDGYPTGWDSPLSGSKPVHEENCQGIKLRIAHKIKRLNSRL